MQFHSGFLSLIFFASVGGIFLPTLIVVILTTIITPILLRLDFSHKIEKAK